MPDAFVAPPNFAPLFAPPEILKCDLPSFDGELIPSSIGWGMHLPIGSGGLGHRGDRIAAQTGSNTRLFGGEGASSPYSALRDRQQSARSGLSISNEKPAGKEASPPARAARRYNRLNGIGPPEITQANPYGTVELLGINLRSSTVAEYDHLTQTIHLHCAEEPHLVDFAKAVFEPAWNSGLRVVEGTQDILRPMIHELRHWVDMNCSVRGLRTLSAIFSLIADQTPNNPVIARLKLDVTLNHFIERFVPTDGNTHYPWQSSFTLSTPKFHEAIRHVSACFYRNSDKSYRTALFKSPIYLGSMLETCAYYQEHRDALPYLSRVTTPTGARQRIEAEAVTFLQDPSRPEYHAIIHAISSAARQSEAADGISLAAGLCTLLLNMPPNMLKDSCQRIESNIQGRRYGGGEVDAARQMREIAWVCPEAALIHNAFHELTVRSYGSPLAYSDELIFDLVPLWRKRQGEFFERSHRHFVETVGTIKGPDYFHDSVPALIENNRWLMEQGTLVPSILGLPKRPPVIFGDGFVLPAAPEFSGVVPNYEAVDMRRVEELLRIQEL
ncbi:hypothetical protein [Pseudomonas citronellolis]|uniref:hypothetical protein n=1 Tax=Pseudomonas citronellolis TaxID=53408 RepID=UPI0021C216DD|nr:hypothetical protein [Pseudomonas citronellolis]UXJ50877.1 hypothetical protein N5P21_23230 [Pseudomonas citronellolis]